MAEQFEQYNVVVIDSSLFPCKLNDEMMNCLKSAKSIYVSGTFHAEIHELKELLSEEDRKNCDSNMKQLNTIIHPKVMNLSAYPELNSDIWDFFGAVFHQTERGQNADRHRQPSAAAARGVQSLSDGYL